MKQRVEEMEREANKLRELQAAAEKSEHTGPPSEGDAAVPMETEEERVLADQRSVYVGNVSVARLARSLAASNLRWWFVLSVCLSVCVRLSLAPPPGGLRRDTGGNPAAFSGVWDYQPSDHPL